MTTLELSDKVYELVVVTKLISSTIRYRVCVWTIPCLIEYLCDTNRDGVGTTAACEVTLKLFNRVLLESQGDLETAAKRVRATAWWAQMCLISSGFRYCY